MLDHPYVTASEFRAHPTYLDTQNLRTGATPDEQDAALNNVLLTASQWVDDELDMPMRAHVHTEYTRARTDSMGRLKHHPEHAPVTAVTGLAVGATPASLDPVTDPQAWIEQQGRIIVAYGPSAPGLNTLQFGTPAPGGELLARWTYVAGYPATQLAAAADAGDTVLTVADPLGIQVGTVLRLWTPGLEEAVTVASAAGQILTLLRPLQGAHETGMTCSALPPTIRKAVICVAAAGLLRPASNAQAPASTGPAPSSTSKDARRTSSGAASKLDDARKLLASYRRIR